MRLHHKAEHHQFQSKWIVSVSQATHATFDVSCFLAFARTLNIISMVLLICYLCGKLKICVYLREAELGFIGPAHPVQGLILPRPLSAKELMICEVKEADSKLELHIAHPFHLKKVNSYLLDGCCVALCYKQS